MNDVWSDLARKHGARCVMSLAIDDATLDAETARQIDIIFPLIKPLLRGDELLALDYGCGAGRFTGALQCTVGCGTLGYDPCAELIAIAPEHHEVDYLTGLGNVIPQVDVVFAAMVLGEPNIDPEKIAENIAALLAPGGLLVILDHMPIRPPGARWWQYRPAIFYVDLFARRGIALTRIGEVDQLENKVTILAGRRG